VQELRNLWHFVQVANAGGFTAAAGRLSLSTAALSKSIARLEARMGVKLFVRTSRRLHLSGEGRALFEKVSGALGTIEDSLEQIRETTTEPEGSVRLSTVTAYGKHCVLPLVPQFLARYPKIDLVMSFHDGGRGLSREAFDVRINWGESREQGKVSQTLCQMPLILVASAAYLARRGVPRTPADLAAHDCINVALPNGVRAHWTFISRGSKRSRVTVAPTGRLIVMDELDAVADAAAEGLGITVSSAENVLDALRDGRLVRVMDGYTVLGNDTSRGEIIVQYPRRKYLPQKVRVLVDFLLERLKGRNPLDLVASSKPRDGS
jgi:DNA-binding transcriptional LysR family regulator